MRQSKLFTKTRREAPADEMARNAQLLIRAGYIHKEMAGVYSLLPLGLKVIKKIEEIIRQEMNLIGGVEMKTSIMQSKEVWEKSNRWDDTVVDNWFKTKLKNGGEVGLSFTNEEAYANILNQFINSYKDLPAYPYDFKEIFRNEARSKSGILRGREFYWKAMYSFSKNEAEHLAFYEKAMASYKNIFNQVGIGDKTYLTYASGGTFSKFSHEFQALCEAGEDLIYINDADYGKGLKLENNQPAINKEIWSEELKKDFGIEKFVEKKAIEVGNIFTLGTKFSEPFDLKYVDENGKDTHIFMGSYGIGLGRLMGTIVEVSNDDKGIIWPEAVSPYQIHLVSLCKDSEQIKQANEFYNQLIKNGKEILYDDRIDVSAGQKFAESDLIGISTRYVISAKTLERGSVEIKKRNEEANTIVDLNSVL